MEFLKSEKSLDFLVVLTILATSTFFIISYEINFFMTTFLYLGLPSVYLGIRRQKIMTKRLLVFVLSFGIVSSVVMGYLGNVFLTWSVPTIFPFKILGELTIEEFWWGMLEISAIMIFYQRFANEREGKFKVRKIYPVLLLLGLISFVLIASVGRISGLFRPYGHLKISLAYFTPLLLFFALRGG